MSSRRLANVTLRVAACVVAVSFVGVCQAQTETGQISGSVTDATGAVVAHAGVRVRSTGSGAERSSVTTTSGNFTVANLLPGSYEISVESPGFVAQTRTVDVQVGSRSTVSFELVVVGVAGVVEVIASAESPRPNTVSPELSTVVTGRQIAALPTVDRDPIALAGISGNVNEQLGSGVDVAINGQRASSVNVLLDGADNNDVFGSGPGHSVPMDSVQEFSVLTSMFSAEFGRASGGVVNVATKSGTNTFHGTVYEFNRLSAFASARFEDNAHVPVSTHETSGIKKAVFTRNQFGFSLGGPVAKDEFQFFSNLEWLRTRTFSTQSFLVPTPELLGASAVATQGFFLDYELKTPINGRIVHVGDIPALGPGPFRDLGSRFPAFGQVLIDVPDDRLGVGDPGNVIQFVGRTDWNISEATTSYARVALQRDDIFRGKVSSSPYVGFDTGEILSDANVLASMTHAFSARLVTQLKFVLNRLSRTQPLGEAPVGPTLYAFEDRVASFAGIPLALPGYLPLGPDSPVPFGGPQNLVQGYSDTSIGIGGHELRFGGSYVHIADNRLFGAFENAAEVLGATRTQALNGLVLGQILRFNRAIDPQGRFPFESIDLPVSSPEFGRENRFTEYALYVSDTWRIRPRVSVSLGTRYEYFDVQHNRDRRLDSNFYPGGGVNFFERIRNGAVRMATDSYVGGLYAPDRNNLAPRVGVAWDVFGDGSTSVRAGYGIGYERQSGEATFGVIRNPPAYGVISVAASDLGLSSLPIYRDNDGPLAGSGSTVLPRTSLEAIDPNIRTAYAHFWSVSFERELFGDTLVSIDYSGSKGVDLYTVSNVNRPFSGAVYLGLPYKGQPGYDASNPDLRLNRQYGDINLRGNDGFSTYNGLTVGVESRNLAGTGLLLTANYTWSHAIDNLSSTLSISENNFNLGLLDPFDPLLDRGDADFDARHRFVTSGVWSSPACPNGSRCKWRFLDGWTVSYILSATTGRPFSIYDCTNSVQVCHRLLEVGAIDTNGSGNPPASQLPADLATGNRHVFIDLSNQLAGAGTYVNPAATAAATAAVGEPTPVSDYGPFPAHMTGRNVFRGPGSWTFDVVVSKTIPLGNRTSLQLRAEGYNVLNHPNLFISETEAEVGTGYVPGSYSGRRQMQLAVRLTF